MAARGLGKGLDSLIPNALGDTKTKKKQQQNQRQRQQMEKNRRPL